MEQNKPKDIGAAWIKTGSYGNYISISLEIDGVKHNFTMFPNKYKQEGSKQPDYRIPAPKTQAQPIEQVNKYQKQLDEVMAQKAAREKLQPAATKNIVGTLMEQAGLLTEQDVPF